MWKRLKELVENVIRANGKGAITGTNLQEITKTIIDSVGEFATLCGIALPNTNPGEPDGPVFYLAITGGNYVNFDSNMMLPDGISVIISSRDSISGLKWESFTVLELSDYVTRDGEQVVRAKTLYKMFRSLGLYNYPEFDIWLAYGKGTKLLYNGDLIEITVEHSPGPLQPFEYVPAVVDGQGGGGGVQADWDENNPNHPSYIKNKPNVPNISSKSYLEVDRDNNLDVGDKVLTMDDNSSEDVDNTIYLIFDRTINRANDAIELINKTIMDLGPWKREVDNNVNNVLTELDKSRGSYDTLDKRLSAMKADTESRIPYSDIKSNNNVDWGSNSEVVSPAAINKHIEDQVATLMTGRVTLKGKWSSISAEGNLNILPGYQYVYDRGNIPVGLVIEPGDILIAVNAIKLPSERDNMDNWIVAQGNIDYANLEGRVSDVEDEIKTARDGENNLNARLNGIDSDISKVNGEVVGARGGKATLNDRLDSIDGDIDTVRDNINTVDGKINDAKGSDATLKDRLDRVDSTYLLYEESDNINDII